MAAKLVMVGCMVGLGELGLRAGRVALLVIAVIAIWLGGRALAGLRGSRPDNVIWYAPDLMGFGLFGIPVAIGAILAHVWRVPGWENDLFWLMVAFGLALLALFTLIVFRYRLVIDATGLAEAYLLRPGARLIPWSLVGSWTRQSDYLVLTLKSGGKFAFTPKFKQGSDALFAMIDAQGIPET